MGIKCMNLCKYHLNDNNGVCIVCGDQDNGVTNRCDKHCQDSDDQGNRKNRYLNVYEVTQQYGGPEEGGWWYNYGLFDGCEGILLVPLGLKC